MEIDEDMVLSVHLISVSDDGPLGMSALANPMTGEVTVINVKSNSLAGLYGLQIGKNLHYVSLFVMF